MIPRIAFLAAFAIAAAFVGGDLYLRTGLRLASCVACVFEFYAFTLIGLITLVALAVSFGTVLRRAFGIAVMAVALVGVAVAGRETWLRYFPRRGWDCGGDLAPLLRLLPGADGLAQVLGSVRDCARAHWHLLGYASDEWAFAGFLLVGLLALLSVRH